MSMELSAAEKALPAHNGTGNHPIPSSPNDESRSVQELVNVEQRRQPIRIKLKRYCRVVAVCVAVAVIWGMLTQPIIIYYANQGQVNV